MLEVGLGILQGHLSFFLQIGDTNLDLAARFWILFGIGL